MRFEAASSVSLSLGGTKPRSSHKPCGPALQGARRIGTVAAQLVAVPSIIILAKFGLGPNVELAAVQYGRGMQQEAVIFYYCER